MKIQFTNGNFGQKLKVWSKMEILVNNKNLIKHSGNSHFGNIKFGQKLKFWAKMKSLLTQNPYSGLY